MKGVLAFLVLFFAVANAFQLHISRSPIVARNALVMRERKCDLSGTRQNSQCMNVSKSNAHTHRVQHVNLQTRKFFWEEGNKTVKIRISCRTLKTIKKLGIHATAKKFGVNLNKFSISSGVAAKAAEAVSA
jgi:large subunit ribosomal protein L28